MATINTFEDEVYFAIHYPEEDRYSFISEEQFFSTYEDDFEFVGRTKSNRLDRARELILKDISLATIFGK